jgi:hypothetical protein
VTVQAGCNDIIPTNAFACLVVNWAISAIIRIPFQPGGVSWYGKKEKVNV